VRWTTRLSSGLGVRSVDDLLDEIEAFVSPTAGVPQPEKLAMPKVPKVPQFTQLALALPTISQGQFPTGGHAIQQAFEDDDEDDYLKFLKKTQGQAAAEKELVKIYQDAAPGSQEKKDAFRQMLNGGSHGSGYRPLLYGTIGRRYLADNQLPESAVKAELTRTFKRSLDSWERDRDIQVNTWVWNNAQKTSRFINRYSQIGRIPESRLKMVRQLHVVREELEDQLGRMPTNDELAAKLGWEPKDVALVTTETRADIVEQDGVDFGSKEDADLADAIDLLHQVRPNLDPEAQRVLDHTYGLNGQREVTNNDTLARTMGLTATRIRTIKRKIAREVDKHRK
jgi:hypothetical protein